MIASRFSTSGVRSEAGIGGISILMPLSIEKRPRSAAPLARIIEKLRRFDGTADGWGVSGRNRDFLRITEQGSVRGRTIAGHSLREEEGTFSGGGQRSRHFSGERRDR